MSTHRYQTLASVCTARASGLSEQSEKLIFFSLQEKSSKIIKLDEFHQIVKKIKTRSSGKN
jgi:hypothetical protein